MTFGGWRGGGARAPGFVSRTPGGLGAPPHGHNDPCARSSLDASAYRRKAQARPEVGEDAAVKRQEAGASRHKSPLTRAAP